MCLSGEILDREGILYRYDVVWCFCVICFVVFIFYVYLMKLYVIEIVDWRRGLIFFIVKFVMF